MPLVTALNPDDVQRITNDRAAYERCLKIKAGVHDVRMANEDPGFKCWAAKHGKTCRTCKVVLIRYDGCSSTRCTCGTVFCYDCAKVDC